MAITIVATPGASNANSFATEVQFIARAQTKLSVPTGTTVAGSTCSETEKKALIEATRMISRLEFLGTRVDTTQVLSHPREYLPDPDAPWIEQAGTADVVYVDDTIVATRVVEATIDLALVMISEGANSLAVADPNQGVIEKTVDVLTTKWASPQARPTGWARYPEVLTALAPFLASAGGGSLALERC